MRISYRTVPRTVLPTFSRPISRVYSRLHLVYSSQPFQDRGRYHIETSPLICEADQWTGFYMITVSVLKELLTDFP